MLASISCKDIPIPIKVEYRSLVAGGILHTAELCIDDGSSSNSSITAIEIDECLQGIMAAYRMFGIPNASIAPQGYIREIYYGGRPFPVLWESREDS